MWNFPLFPEQATRVAGHVDAVFFYALGIVLFFTTLICVLILTFAIKYRRGSKANRENAVTQNHTIEMLWIGIPLALAMILFAVTMLVYFEMYRPPEGTSEVYVLGRQWMWETTHPENGKREINELHWPVDRPVRLTMTSEDVIHSFFIPAFRIKQDVLPGRYTSMWFQPNKIGKYHLFCAEYLRHEALGDDRLDPRHGPRGLPAVARERHHGGLAGGRGGAALQGVGVQRLPRPERVGPGAAARRGLRAPGPAGDGRAHHGRRARTSATRSCGRCRRSWPVTSR